jgi:hypothetical protein
MPDWVTDISTVRYSPMVDSYSVDESFIGLDVSDMAAGNTRMRQLFTVDVQTDNVSINVGNATQLDTFLRWVRDNLDRGTQKFTMPVLYGDTFVDRTCQIVGGGNAITVAPHGPKNFLVTFKRRVEEIHGV